MNGESHEKNETDRTFEHAQELKSLELNHQKSPREIIDPNGTLPHIELEEYEVYESEALTRRRMRIVFNGEPIGRCTLQEHKGSVHFDGIELDDVDTTEVRGKGYGLATYLQAIEYAHERGLPFETQDWNQTEDAKKVWMRLYEDGVAEEIEPFQPDTSSPHPNRYKGKYRVVY